MNKIITILLLLGISISKAQNVKGKVIDHYGHPIENAYILNTSTQSHSHTNEFGTFTIEKTPTNTILKISALGFKKTEFTVTNDTISIPLEEDSFQLSEVVIQQTLSAMNVITKIDLETSPVNSTQEILRDRKSVV